MKKFTILSGIDRKTWQTLALELIVVFLGVTAGFILNDWGAQRQAKDLEQKYIDGFVRDVEMDIDELRSGIRSDSLWLVRMDPLLSTMHDGSLSIDSAEAAMSMILNARKITAHTGTFETITNSGSLNLITNFDLRSKLVDYYLTLSGVQFVEDHLYNYFNTSVMPFASRHYSLMTLSIESPEVIKSVEFENLIAGYYNILGQRQEEYRKMVAQSRELRMLLLESY